MKRKFTGLMLGAALVGVSYAQAGILIDNFDTPQAEISRTTAGESCTSTSGPGILGGTRELCLSVAPMPSGLEASAQVLTLAPAFGGSVLNLNNNAGVNATVSLEYADLGGVDINTDPVTGDDKPWLIFRIQSMDHDLTVIVELEDTDGDVATNTYIKLAPPITDRCFPGGTAVCPDITQPIGTAGVGTLPGNYFHAWSLFVSPGSDPVSGAAFGGHNAALNLDSLDRIHISFATAGGEIELLSPCIYSGGGPTPAGAGTVFDPATDGAESAQCTVVPEPGSLLLLGTGMLGLGLFGARRHVNRKRRQA